MTKMSVNPTLLPPIHSFIQGKECPLFFSPNPKVDRSICWSYNSMYIWLINSFKFQWKCKYSTLSEGRFSHRIDLILGGNSGISNMWSITYPQKNCLLHIKDSISSTNYRIINKGITFFINHNKSGTTCIRKNFWNTYDYRGMDIIIQTSCT